MYSATHSRGTETNKQTNPIHFPATAFCDRKGLLMVEFMDGVTVRGTSLTVGKALGSEEGKAL
jgi:hypothetical protein